MQRDALMQLDGIANDVVQKLIRWKSRQQRQSWWLIWWSVPSSQIENHFVPENLLRVRNRNWWNKLQKSAYILWWHQSTDSMFNSFQMPQTHFLKRSKERNNLMICYVDTVGSEMLRSIERRFTRKMTLLQKIGSTDFFL